MNKIPCDYKYIDLDFSTSFVLEFYNLPDLNNYLETYINFLRSIYILAFPCNEGKGIAGYFFTEYQKNILISSTEKYKISFGSSHKKSFIIYNKCNSLCFIGSQAIVAAYRGIIITKDQSIWKLSDHSLKPHKSQISKDSLLTNSSLKEKVFANKYLNPNLEISLFSPIDFYNVKIMKFKLINALKIDINGFSKSILNLDDKETAKYIKKNLYFFDNLEKEFRNLSNNLYIGERTSDSIAIYFEDKNLIPKIENILKSSSKNIENKFKAVAINLNNIGLASYKNYIIYSSKPISSDTWHELEMKHKNLNLQSHNIYSNC